MLCGPRDFIRDAHRVRKMLGGGMRQVGVIAAAGLVALRKGPGRLAEDHENAKRLALALAELPGVEIDPATVETNILVLDVTPAGWSAGEFARVATERGVRLSAVSPSAVRLVWHLDVDDEGTAHAERVVTELLSKEAPAR
jgi:threonine aldolase